MAIQNPLYGKELSEGEASSEYVSASKLNAPNGVATLDSNAKLTASQVPALTTQVGFGGAIVSVPYTDGGDVQISKGITFPATPVLSSNVNTLDDYKEGTWTPVIESYFPGTGRVTTISNAIFTKIGNLVTFTMNVTLTTLGTGGAGWVVVNGLPYTSSSGGNTNHWGCNIPYFTGLKTAVIQVLATVQPGSTSMFLRGWSTAATTVPLLDFATYMQAGVGFVITGFYHI